MKPVVKDSKEDSDKTKMEGTVRLKTKT